MVDKLPLTNKKTLQHIAKMCQAIAARSDENKMTEPNLAIVLCPNCLYSKVPSDPMNMVQEMELANFIFGRVIVNYTVVFPAEEEDLEQDAYVPPAAPGAGQEAPSTPKALSTPPVPAKIVTPGEGSPDLDKKKVVRKKLRKESRSMSTGGDAMRPKISLPLDISQAASAPGSPASLSPHTPTLTKKASALLPGEEGRKKKKKLLSSADALKITIGSISADNTPKKTTSPRGLRKHESTKSMSSPRSTHSDSVLLTEKPPATAQETRSESLNASSDSASKPAPEKTDSETASEPASPPVRPAAVEASPRPEAAEPQVSPTSQPNSARPTVDKIDHIIQTARSLESTGSPASSMPNSARSVESSDYDSSDDTDPLLDPIAEGTESGDEDLDRTIKSAPVGSSTTHEKLPAAKLNPESTPPAAPVVAVVPTPEPDPVPAVVEPEILVLPTKLAAASEPAIAPVVDPAPAVAAATPAPTTPEPAKQPAEEHHAALSPMKPPTPIAVDFARKDSGWRFGPVRSQMETSSSKLKLDIPAAPVPEIEPLLLSQKAMQPMPELQLLADAALPLTALSHHIRHLVFLSYTSTFGQSHLDQLNTSLREIAQQCKALSANISTYMDAYPNEAINLQSALVGLQSNLRDVVMAVKQLVLDPTVVESRMNLGSTSQTFVSKLQELYEICYGGVRDNLSTAVSEAIQRLASCLGLILRGAISKTLTDEFVQLEQTFQAEAAEFVRLVELRSCLLGSGDAQTLEQELDRAVHTVKAFLEKGLAVSVDPDDDTAAGEIRFLARDLVAALRAVEALLKQDSIDFGYDDTILRRRLASSTKVLREWEITARLESTVTFAGRVREHVVPLYENIINFISRPDYWPPPDMMRAVEAISRSSTKILVLVKEMKLESDKLASPEALHVRAYASGALSSLNRIRICGALAALEMNEDVFRLLMGSLARLFNVFHALLL